LASGVDAVNLARELQNQVAELQHIFNFWKTKKIALNRNLIPFWE
jgi:hypothetical protein